MKKTNEGRETRELNLIANKGGSGSVGFKLSIPKPWAAALGVDLNNRTVATKLSYLEYKNKPQLPKRRRGLSRFFGAGVSPPLYPLWRTIIRLFPDSIYSLK